MNEEIWKDIPGYEGEYQVSNLGRVKSLNYNHTNKEKILKYGKHTCGYLMVNLYKNGNRKTCYIHRLVVESFMGKPLDNDYCSINHIDEDKENNKLENLQYCTVEFNNKYGTRLEKYSKPVIGVNKINGYIVDYQSAYEVERCLKIKASSINACCLRKRKSAGGYKWFYKNNEEVK